ncbi:MAG: hypothetical protein IJA07_04515 [Agathobacter sp.]|nr:hypothetical protein [Agathobacter sp.]
MKQFKKLIACVMAATLVLGSTTVFFGAETSKEGTLGGEADFEGSVNTEVFNVVAPTVSATDEVFDFILDPEGLIEITSGNAYSTDGSVEFATYGSMYFKVTEDQYDVKSQALTVTNKSSVDVNITLNATVTVPATNASIALSEDANWAATDDALEIYLAVATVEDDEIATESAIATKSDNKYTGNVEAELASFNAYKVVYNATTETYDYVIDENVEATPATYSFCVTGACNSNADWSDYDNTGNPTISVVWTVEMEGAEVEEAEPSATPLISTLEYTSDKTDLVVDFELGLDSTAATGITSIKTGSSQTSFATTNHLTKCTVDTANGKLTLPMSTLFGGAEDGAVRYVQVIFNDTARTTFVLKITFDLN